jgi:hypothetical protein
MATPEGLLDSKAWAAANAILLVADFHALAYPGQCPEILDVGDVLNVPERYAPNAAVVMKDPAVALDEKVKLVRRHYLPVARYVVKRSVTDSEEAIIAYCDGQLKVPGFGEDFRSEDGGYVRAADVLPDVQVLRSMRRDFLEQGRYKCPHLRSFIQVWQR